MVDQLSLAAAPAPAKAKAKEPDPLKGGDVYKWALEQAAHIRAGRFDKLDISNLADEIDDLGRSEYNALQSDLTIVIQHMLKWDYQPARRSRSWELSIREHRRRVARRLKASPSLAASLDIAFEEAFSDGRDRALAETGLSDDQIPSDCPYALEDVFDRAFLADP